MYCTCPVFVQNEYNYSKYCSFEYEILKNIERKKNRCYNYCTENFAYELQQYIRNIFAIVDV